MEIFIIKSFVISVFKNPKTLVKLKFSKCKVCKPLESHRKIRLKIETKKCQAKIFPCSDVCFETTPTCRVLKESYFSDL